MAPRTTDSALPSLAPPSSDWLHLSQLVAEVTPVTTTTQDAAPKGCATSSLEWKGLPNRLPIASQVRTEPRARSSVGLCTDR